MTIKYRVVGILLIVLCLFSCGTQQPPGATDWKNLVVLAQQESRKVDPKAVLLAVNIQPSAGFSLDGPLGIRFAFQGTHQNVFQVHLDTLKQPAEVSVQTDTQQVLDKRRKVDDNDLREVDAAFKVVELTPIQADKVARIHIAKELYSSNDTVVPVATLILGPGAVHSWKTPAVWQMMYILPHKTLFVIIDARTGNVIETRQGA